MQDQNHEADIRQIVTTKLTDKRPDPYAHIELDATEINTVLTIARDKKKVFYTEEDAVVELNEQEIEEALSRARQRKSGILHNIRYTERIGQAIAYPKYTTEEFAAEVLKKLKLSFPKEIKGPDGNLVTTYNNYVIDKENNYVFWALVKYFIKDPAFLELNPDFDFNKGIAIQGPIGCGKTSLLRGFNVNPTNCFRVLSCRDIAGEYTHKEYGGDPIITKYSSIFNGNPQENWGQREIGLFADDLGTEDVVKHYGNEKNVMENIILNRYGNLQLRSKTHITTNLSKTQIEEIYGPRIRSRMEEMFNWIVFDRKSKDRRK